MNAPRASFWRRRNYLIHPRFQLTIVFVNVVCSLIGFGCVFLVLKGFFSEMIGLGHSAGFPDDHPYFQFLGMQFDSLGSNLILVFAFSILASSVLSVWISHQAVGPIYKLTMYLRSLQALPRGAPRPALQFRKNDLFGELPDLVNDVVGAKKDDGR